MTPLLKALISACSVIALGTAAYAQTTTNPSEWSRPYGQAYGTETQAYAGTRRGGNRVVVNGIMQTGVGVSARTSVFTQSAAGVGVNTSTGSLLSNSLFASANASAVGNQLNVVVNGNYNTVVVNNRQTNTGNITANAGAVAANANSQSTAGASDNDN